MSKTKWISAAEAADILDTYPDKINYWGGKGMFGYRVKHGNEWRYSRQRVSQAGEQWALLELSDVKGEWL